MVTNYKIAKISVTNLKSALDLVWKVFLEFEAPEYSKEGVKEFKDFIEFDVVADKIIKSQMKMWGCFDKGNIVGMIATKEPCHITLLFVDKEYHHQGIARALYDTVLTYYKDTTEPTIMTVNSSPYAKVAYEKLGFIATDEEQVTNGIRYIPMRHKIR